tara:strand:+ start:80 stop:484 length:405 start_codon:yes stop_codon:yes gene_type:complete
VEQVLKPTVIYYRGISYGLQHYFYYKKNKNSLISTYSVLDFDSEEDLDNVSLSDEKLAEYWKNIDNLNIKNWKKDYFYGEDEPEPLTDGYSWELRLRNPDGKVIISKGYEKFPRNFNKFIKELNKLFKTNIKKI